MNNLTEKEQLIIKTMIENKINELEKKKSKVKTATDYIALDNYCYDLRRIMCKISK